MSYEIHCGDSLDVLRTIPDASVDACISDPPYPMIKRDYGMLTEDEWWALMMGVCTEVRRVLKPTGSAVFILQPNSRKVGSMRGWLWRFMWWVTTDWNMVQDAYWWNYNTMPTVHCTQHRLMRGSIKPIVWAGARDCYRNQINVLWSRSERTTDAIASSAYYRMGRSESPSGHVVKRERMNAAADARGGVTPFNLLPVPQTQSRDLSAAYGHGAGTPLALADWWTRYIVPPSGVVLDPFNGAGTMGVAALQNGCSYIGIEKMQKYVDVTHDRLAKVQPVLEAA